MKYFILSFDDGTIHDKHFVELLNKYQVPCTFNLNSGLEDFVWEFEGNPVIRQHLADTVEQYRGHEIASHSLTHPRLEQLPPPRLRHEVEEDCAALKRIFGMPEIGFGVPFTVCGEREIRIIKKHVRYIRLSEYSDSFALPDDLYIFLSMPCTMIRMSGRKSQPLPRMICRILCSLWPATPMNWNFWVTGNTWKNSCGISKTSALK